MHRQGTESRVLTPRRHREASLATVGMRAEDERWMSVALDEARRALEEGEVPIGAVVVVDGRVVGRGHNQVEGLADPTAHAEVIAIGAACRSLGVPRLTEGVIYASMEPCPMCAGAIVNARLKRLVYGCHDPKAGYSGTLTNALDDSRLNHRVSVTSGVMADESGALVSGFFQTLRSRRP
jgi:tRNA(adenine34) deaminase